MRLKNLLKVRGSRKVEEEVEQEKKKKDPKTVEAQAILNAPRNNQDNTKNSEEDSS